MVQAKKVTTPAVLAWMRDYQQRVLSDNGYKGESAVMQEGVAVPGGASLTDLFRGQKLTMFFIKSLLKNIDQYLHSRWSPTTSRLQAWPLACAKDRSASRAMSSAQCGASSIRQRA